VRARGAADRAELAAELTKRTEDAVRARLVADVPVGVFLSGGLDSSFLAACATRVHPRVKTFTVGFDDESFDESEHARLVARHLGTEHVEHRLATQALLEIVPSTLDWMDEPFADSSLVPTTLLAREARQEVKVALGGEGGDELLAGYPTFVVDQALGHLPVWPSALAGLARRAAAVVPADAANFSPSFKARQLAQGLDRSGARRHASWLAALLPRDLARLAGPRLTGQSIACAFDAVDTSAMGTRTSFDAATAFYLSLYLGEGVLTKVDRATMRASLEARAPLLDTRVVDLCLSLDPSLCVRGGVTKWLMREAVRPLVPSSIVARPKKGFGAPVGAWIRGPLRAFAEATLAPARVREGGWLDATAVSKMLAAHVAGRADLRKPLYAALVFEHWRQRWGC
jgi:asparagine synthase (glutamine-hydrolysing)